MQLLQKTQEGYSDFQVTGMIKWGEKSKPTKSLGLPTKPKKSLDQKLTPKKSHAKFPRLKNVQEGLNDLTWKKKTLEIECLCLFILIIPMVLYFRHLVVTLATLGTPMNLFCFNNDIMNDNSKQDHPEKNKFGCTLFARIRGHYHGSSDCFKYPKKSLLKSSHPKNY